MFYIIIFYGKEFACRKVIDFLVCFNRHALFLGLLQGGHFGYHVIFIYLELAGHDKQNGGQNFNL